MIVLDASVLIAHLESADVHHDRATELLADAVEDPWGASPMTLTEVLVGPARSGTLKAAEAAIGLLEIDAIDLLDDAPVRLATLRATTRLRLPDCCVLLAAMTTGAEMATFDDRLAAAATELGLTVRS
ncbi:type II toxin-antitoxin system VapC family toxin [Skermania piniformis]|uniref:Ribonuclease VapC n=1 Tax=Skermania pinensis TaxID=39122 RepID=A0ABX8S3Y8_9ACTN|nr:type II toxin-antitoxin system VapC family toxin [Skermania piniformis]QXQ12543.1 type II toxin-antitoxin system VapC family toxin [Skermania piniformis]